MQNYSVSVEFKIDGNDKENCNLNFIVDEIQFFQMTYHWISVKDSTRDFGKLPKLIERMENVLKYGSSSYILSIDNIHLWISDNIISFSTYCTHVNTLSLAINESLIIAYKKVYNWYMKYRQIYEESAPPVILVENNDTGFNSPKYFGSIYKTVTLPKDKLPENPHPPYEVD